MEEHQKHSIIIDDTHTRISVLIKLRLPWLVVGLIGGLLASFLVSQFEDILSQDIRLAFFVPLIVYISDAVGTQTETIYVRNLAKFKDNFYKYLFKESLIGLCLGGIFGVVTGVFAYLWLNSLSTALTVALAMFVNVAVSPIVALIVPEILFKEHADPALGGGPFTTVLQDIISLTIYFLIASLIIL